MIIRKLLRTNVVKNKEEIMKKKIIEALLESKLFLPLPTQSVIS